MARLRTRFIVSFLLLILYTGFSFFFLWSQVEEIFLLTQSNNELRDAIALTAVMIIILAAAGAILISLFLCRDITKPLGLLDKAACAISKKDFNQRVKVRTFSEISKLVDNFNAMSHQLKLYGQETRKHSQNLEELVRERTKELSYIYKIGREVSSTLELDEVLDAIVRRTAEALNLKTCAILLVDEIKPDRLRVMRVEGLNLKKAERQTLKKGEGISGWAWNNKQPLLIKDVNEDPRFIGRSKEKYYTGSMICVPLEAKDKIIGILNANNKFSGKTFREEELLLLQEIATESAIAIENALLYRSLKQIYLHTISALASALEAKDRYTRSHSENVTRYAVALAEELGLNNSQIDIIRQACQLHDLGKIGIHDYILTKTGELTAEEWDEIKLHALRGAQILEPMDFLSEVADLVKQHHERYDGTGYPLNISGQDIRLGARIMTVADAFDAMISERPYRKALSLSQAKEELKNNSGSQFDPELVRVFLKLLEARPDLVKPSK